MTANGPKSVPLYSQIMAGLVEAMEQGQLQPGDRIPSERQLAERYGVSRMTARQALVELERQGYLVRYQGKGTFVAGPKLEQPLMALTSFTEDMHRLGIQPGARVLSAEQMAAGRRVATALGIAEVDPVYRLERLRLAGGIPVAVESTYIPAVLCPGLPEAMDDEASLYQVLEERYGLQLVSAVQSLECILASPADGERLAVPESTPLLFMERVTRDREGRPVEFTQSLYRGDRFRFRIELNRQAGEGPAGHTGG